MGSGAGRYGCMWADSATTMEATFDIFETECQQYLDTVEYNKWYHCAPRVARQLRGKSKTAMVGAMKVVM